MNLYNTHLVHSRIINTRSIISLTHLDVVKTTIWGYKNLLALYFSDAKIQRFFDTCKSYCKKHAKKLYFAL